MKFFIKNWHGSKLSKVFYFVLMLFATLIMYCISPYFSVVASLFFLAMVFENKYIRMSLIVVFFMFLYSMLVFFKPINGDWVWYTKHYKVLQSLDFFSYYGHTYGPFTIKLSEPVYYFLSFVLSRLTDANITVLAIVVSVVFYSVFTYSLFKLTQYLSVTSWQQNFVVIAAILLSVTPTLVLHLVRQEMASVFLFCGISLLLCGNKWLAALFLGLSFFTHQSASLVLAILAISYLLARYFKRGGWLFSFLLSILLGLVYVKSGYFVTDEVSGRSDGYINPIVYAYDFTLMILFVISTRGDQVKPSVKVYVLSFVAFYVGFLLGIAFEPLPLLRMYFYVEWFRAFFIAVVLCRIASTKYFGVVSFFILSLGFFYTNYRIILSALGFPFSIFSLAMKPVFFWMYII